MAQEQPETRSIPPYVPWKTFAKFIEGLRTAMPSRIDRSLMGTMSGAIQAQLIASLRYLDLITENGTATDRLRQLVKSTDGEDFREKLGDVILSGYGPIFGDPETGGVDMDNGTYKQLFDAFGNTGAQGETIRKCIAFWLAAMKAGGMTTSPHFVARGVRGYSASKKKRERGIARPAGGSNDASQDADDEDDLPPVPLSRFEVLMSKFPTFDPTWAPEVQAKWFDAFERIQKSEGGGE
jgi:hypothetical protein